MAPTFHNKQGLTAYSFACGYVQDIKVKDTHIELYLDGGVYATRVFRSKLGEGFERLEWVCEESLSDARQHFEDFVRAYLPELVTFNQSLATPAWVGEGDPTRGKWRCGEFCEPSKWEAVAKAYNSRMSQYTNNSGER